MKRDGGESNYKTVEKTHRGDVNELIPSEQGPGISTSWSNGKECGKSGKLLEDRTDGGGPNS